MITINTRAELRTAKREVKKLIEKALQSARETNKVLARGCWGNPCSRSVCLVGAIGLINKPLKFANFNPVNVAPLIKNGASKWIHDTELWLLSDGFEGNCAPRPYRYQNRWTNEYRLWLWKQGRRVGKNVPSYMSINQ